MGYLQHSIPKSAQILCKSNQWKKWRRSTGHPPLSKLATLLDIGQEPNTANTSLDYYVFPVEDFEPRRGNVREQRAATCSVDTKEKEKVAQTLQDRLFTSAFLW
ncbi:SubName: Full=Uncharacterized protein {ECO:0000313/EMBL:CCA70060.1} [Serendipita indica DSM 11827]|uniref:Uncharacterized protein n=1 Tax=Serendipita indica (strain DSM 11827) TaxID=1109443 RepID=G4TFG6_SERID|nr:SubName: Full=Uncharacterized protein {ECO:0000313/EMBL:CCA70060.1} [Serendipita indica DSM 11827]CCA70060.1 hypothetical protein PIIN_04000 [Serendipita indica DSM 11827]